MGNPEELYGSGEARYLRLGADGKVYYITAVETRKEEILARPRGELSDQDIIVFEWNDRVKRAEQLKGGISLAHKMVRVDDQMPSRYQADYDALWGEYRDAITDLIELDSEPVARFRDKVAAKLKELELKVNAVCDSYDNWDPDNFDEFERMLVCYEKNFDLMVVLQKVA